MTKYFFVIAFIITLSLPRYVHAQDVKLDEIKFVDIDYGANEEGEEAYVEVYDPLEGMNRLFFDFNDMVHVYLLRPVSIFYKDYTPGFFQSTVRNVTQNIMTPITILNALLQGDIKKTDESFGRFFVNSTIGLGGIFDVASEIGLPKHDEDFGQTLGYYGVEAGPYIVLPILGPSTLRDRLAGGVDSSVGLYNHIDANYSGRLFGLGTVDFYSRQVGMLDKMKETSIDYYASIRSFYLQNREGAVKNRLSR